MEEVSSTMVSVRLPELPIEFFSEELLLQIGNLIGRAIRVDLTTISHMRERFARLCIQIYLKKPLIPMMHIMGYNQRIEYKGLHRICFECGQYRHRMEIETWKSN